MKKLKEFFDRVFGESRTETTTRMEHGNRIVTVKYFKGDTCIYQSVTTYYPGFSINI